jgi:hypothetical protein
MIDDVPDSVKKCLDILDDSLEILVDIEFALKDEKNDELKRNDINSYIMRIIDSIDSNNEYDQ